MSMNKRHLRKFADPGLKFRLDSGILHASQISHIIRTAVKVIDHRRTLVLYVYPRSHVLAGDCTPRYTVFQTREDFLTLYRKENGTTTWHTAAFDHLDSSYRFSDYCAFYSARDEIRMVRYLKGNSDGLSSLADAQQVILTRRSMERQSAREQAVINRMSCIPALPRGLKHWIRSVMPSYFFYDYKRGGTDVPGVCSSCGHEIRLSSVKQGIKQICPHCRKELICKPRSRRSQSMYDRGTFQVIQSTGNGGLVIRIIKAYYSYNGDILSKTEIYENARQFVHQDADGEIQTDSYYYAPNKGLLTNWKKGNRPLFLQYQYNFEADTCGHLYTRNLPDALADTPWQYCPIDIFYNHFREPMQALPFLRAYLEHPRLEHLVKVGFCTIASDLAYGRDNECLDKTQNRTHRILQVAAEDVPFLRELDVGLSVLKTFQSYAGIKGRKELLAWQLEHDIQRDILQIVQYVTVQKAIHYLDKQYEFLRLRRTPTGSKRYRSMQDLVSEYRDYLEICEKLGYDMKNSFVLRPKDLQKEHDRAARRLKHKADAKMKRDFIAFYKRIGRLYDFEKRGMKIIYPNSPSDVVFEGHTLHHCVGSYTDRVAKHECLILFLRKCSDETKPFYTVEVRDQKVVQVRGMKNCAMTPEVQDFITAWEQQVLSRIPDIAA